MSARRNEINTPTLLFFVILILVIIGMILIGRETLNIRIAIALPIVFLVIWIFMRMRSTHSVEAWARSHQLKYAESVPKERIFERIRTNPKKSFFTSDKILQQLEKNSSSQPKSILSALTENQIEISTGPFVEGIIEGRHVWFYPMFDAMQYKDQR